MRSTTPAYDRLVVEAHNAADNTGQPHYILGLYLSATMWIVPAAAFRPEGERKIWYAAWPAGWHYRPPDRP